MQTKAARSGAPVVLAMAAVMASPQAGCDLQSQSCTTDDGCASTADCPSNEYCDLATCTCLGLDCDPMDECREDADCPSGRCDYDPTDVGCFCVPEETTLSPRGLATLAGSGLTASGHFEEIEGCPGPSSFDAPFDIAVAPPAGDGTSAITLVQGPGGQQTAGLLRADVTFVVRDAASGYDELYIGVFERTAGTDPAAPLSVATLLARAINVNGAEGILAPVTDARVEAAIDAGALDPAARDAAIVAMLEGVTGACVLDVSFSLRGP